MARTPQLLRLGAAVGAFFGLKIVIGLVLVAASAHQLSVRQFVTFSQLFLCLALLTTVSAGAVQGGVMRQVAVAEGDLAAERRATAAGLAIWAGFASILLIVAALFGSAGSRLLVGAPSLARPILVVTVTAVLGGAGSILTSVLTGRRQVLLSLGLQAIGMLISGVACYARLRAGDPVGSVLAYAAGPLATAALALPFARDVLPRPGRSVERLRAEIRLLLGYSIAGLAVAVVMPATLFGLRSAYRSAFGAELLGYWLAANRVSDVTSQLLGIYVGQIYLPRMAQTTEPHAARRLAVQTFILGSAAMAAGWAVFSAGAPFFVQTFFSRQFLPAIPFIGGYLLGDALRVSASLMSATVAARGRPLLCIGVEATVAALITAYVLALTALDRPEAPWLGYVLAQMTMTAAVLLAGRRLLRAGDPRGRVVAANVPIGIQGSEAG